MSAYTFYVILQVIEELWNHYLEFHQKDLQQQATANPTTNASSVAVSSIAGIQAVPVPVVISSNSSLQQLYTTSPTGNVCFSYHTKKLIIQ